LTQGESRPDFILIPTMVDAAGATVYAYAAAGLLQSEDGPRADDAVSYTYQNRQRTGLSLQQPTSGPWSQAYSHGAAARLANVTSPAGAFAYGFNAGRASLPASLTLPGSSLIPNSHDALGRLYSHQRQVSGRRAWEPGWLRGPVGWGRHLCHRGASGPEFGSWR
jgi:hypothetical protein